MNENMPVLFLGHGNPMHAIEDSAWGRAWAALAQNLPRPHAVLSISAHWYVDRTAVTSMDEPRTIHDFAGFPKALFEVQYPAPGDSELAAKTARLLDHANVSLDEEWGIDHGSWSVLRHMYPDADIPVVQLSIHKEKPAAWHFALARHLAPLRADGVLIVGSGNVVHNLRLFAWKNAAAEPFDWALRFETAVRQCIENHEFAPLVDYQNLGTDARLAVPTPEHYLPLLYVLAQHRSGERISFPVEGFDGGSVSMLAVQLG